jgi:hypothetical protein
MKMRNLLSAIFAGAIAISMMAFASFADSTDDTTPAEEDPGISEEITDEITEDITDEITEDITDEVTEEVTEEVTTTAETTAEVTAPAAGDTAADGNPKTGVALALIPAAAAAIGLVAARKRK